jgi:ribosomal protein L1
VFICLWVLLIYYVGPELARVYLSLGAFNLLPSPKSGTHAADLVWKEYPLEAN